MLPPVAVPVSVRFAPLHIGLGVAEAVTDVGVVLTVTAVVTAVVLPQELVAVIVYTPALVVTTPVTPVTSDEGAVMAVPPGLAQE